MSSVNPSSAGEASFSPITESTKAVLTKLLGMDFSGSQELRKQVDELACRQIDKEGSLQLRVAPGAPAAQVEERVPVEAELEDSDGVLIHLQLHVVDGYLDELEVYREDMGLPIRELSPDDMTVLFLTPEGWEIDSR